MSDLSDFNDLQRVAGGGAVAAPINAAIANHRPAEKNATERDCEGRGLAAMAKRTAGQSPKPRIHLLMTKASSVKPEPIRWLWRGKIALGKLTLIAGDPGLGKSMLTANLAAHVSTGKHWPANGGECPLGDVLFVSAEDDPADTIRPRLDAAGADVARVHIVAGVESFNANGDAERRLLSLRKDLTAIAEAVRSLDTCRLIVIDPVSAYLDGADSHNNAEVRSLLAPLSELAREVGAAMVCVTHLNKGTGGSALYRATGSLAFVAAARAAWLVARDNADNDRRLFLPLKNNLGPDSSGMAYRIEETESSVPYVKWEDQAVDISADDALGAARDKDHETTLAESAEEWLRDVLALGPVKSKDIKSFALEAGYTWSTIRRAQASIGIDPQRAGGFGKEGYSVWCLPAGEESKQLPLPGATNG